MSGTAQIDFSSIGGVPVQAVQSQAPKPIDFSSIGGKPAQGASEPADTTTAKAAPVPTATIGRAPGGATGWLDDLEADIKYGTGNTFIGRALQKMGAQGVDVGSEAGAGDFVASPILGTVRAAKGVTEIPSHPWQGTKDVVGGALDAATIPFAMGTGESVEGASELAGKAETAIQKYREASNLASQSKQLTDEWQKINDVLGVAGKGIRIGKDATTLEDAATMPGRGVASLGITSDELSKMTPIERMAAIAPSWHQAGAAIDSAVQAATDAGKTLDAGDSAFDVLKRITHPDLQQKAVDSFNALGKNLTDPITNWREVTPAQALELRRALQPGARFGPNGDLNSLGAIRAQLYSAVSSDLHDAVPSLGKLDQNYSDLRGAITAAQSSVSKVASKAPPPTLTEKAISIAKKEIPRAAIYSGLGGLGYGGYRYLRDLAGP